MLRFFFFQVFRGRSLRSLASSRFTCICSCLYLYGHFLSVLLLGPFTCSCLDWQSYWWFGCTRQQGDRSVPINSSLCLCSHLYSSLTESFYPERTSLWSIELESLREAHYLLEKGHDCQRSCATTSPPVQLHIWLIAVLCECISKVQQQDPTGLYLGGPTLIMQKLVLL